MSATRDVDALWARFKGGDDSARSDLMEAYYGLVRSVASGEPDRTDMDREDLIGYGVIGLADAIERFDPTRGVKFETYAWDCIKRKIREEVRGFEWVEKRVHQRVASVARAQAMLEGKLGRFPTVAEIADELGKSIEWVDGVRRLEQRIKLGYLDAPSGQGARQLRPVSSYRIVDGLSDAGADSPENSFDVEEMRRRLADAILSLSRQHRVILALRYRAKFELGQVANVVGVSRTRASQLQTEAVEALRAALAGAHVDAFLGGRA